MVCPPPLGEGDFIRSQPLLGGLQFEACISQRGGLLTKGQRMPPPQVGARVLLEVESLGSADFQLILMAATMIFGFSPDFGFGPLKPWNLVNRRPEMD